STPLHFASATSSHEAVTALLEFGADVNAREAGWGQTPLHFAASAGRFPTVEILIAACADLNAATTVVDMRLRAAEDRAAGQIRDRALQEFRGPRSGTEAWSPTPEQVQEAIRRARDLSDDEVQ